MHGCLNSAVGWWKALRKCKKQCCSALDLHPTITGHFAAVFEQQPTEQHSFLHCLHSSRCLQEWRRHCASWNLGQLCQIQLLAVWSCPTTVHVKKQQVCDSNLSQGTVSTKLKFNWTYCISTKSMRERAGFQLLILVSRCHSVCMRAGPCSKIVKLLKLFSTEANRVHLNSI